MMIPLVPCVPHEGHCFPRLLQPSDINNDTKTVAISFFVQENNYQNSCLAMVENSSKIINVKWKPKSL